MFPKTEVVDIPRGIGVEGIVRSLRAILQLSRVQEVRISNKGHVEYTRLVEEGDRAALALDLDSLKPYNIVRNGEVVELHDGVEELEAARAVSVMFGQTTFDRLFPIAFLSGPKTRLWAWFQKTSNLRFPATDDFFGLPLLADPAVEDETLLLLTGQERGAAVIDTHRTYKIRMSEAQ